jgi:hypothetical protein
MPTPANSGVAFLRYLELLSPGFQKYLEPFLDDCVTLARGLLEAWTVEDLNGLSLRGPGPPVAQARCRLECDQF